MQHLTAVTGDTSSLVTPLVNTVYAATFRGLVDQFVAGGTFTACTGAVVTAIVILAVGSHYASAPTATRPCGCARCRLAGYLRRYRDRPAGRHASSSGRSEVLPTGQHAAEPVSLDDLAVEQQLAERARERELRAADRVEVLTNDG